METIVKILSNFCRCPKILGRFYSVNILMAFFDLEAFNYISMKFCFNARHLMELLILEWGRNYSLLPPTDEYEAGRAGIVFNYFNKLLYSFTNV